MSESTSSTFSIFDFPNEILIEIIHKLNLGERIRLANTSKKFYQLLIENTRLSSNVDVTEKGSLTCGDSLAEIEQYFNNPKKRQCVLKLNWREGRLARSKLEKLFNPPTTLADLYAQTVKFETIVQLGIFLDPFIHLQSLSIEWPGQVMKIGNNLDRFYNAWQTPFSRLRYLAVTVNDLAYREQLLPDLRLCQELKELRIFEPRFQDSFRADISYTKLEPLKNLEILVFGGRFFRDDPMYNCITELCTDFQEWVYLCIGTPRTYRTHYHQKRVGHPGIPREPEGLSYDSLFELMLNSTYEVETSDLGRLRLEKHYEDEWGCEERESLFRLKVDEIKFLLNGDMHKIRHLEQKHSIESDCIVHLVAAAFPNLTELVLRNVVKIDDVIHQKTHPKKRLRKRSDAGGVPDDYLNLNGDSSFKILVENTPHLKSLTMNWGGSQDHDFFWLRRDDEVWDLDALLQIAGWKKLRRLSLNGVPLRDGKFLVEISKQCRYLEELEFHNFNHGYSFYYLKELCQLLADCPTLRDLKITQGDISQISEVFASLKHNPVLRTVCVTLLKEDHELTLVDLASPIERLLRRCPNLTTLRIHDDTDSDDDVSELRSALTRLKDELDRPALQFEVHKTEKNRNRRNLEEGIVNEDLYRDDLMPYYFPEST